MLSPTQKLKIQLRLRKMELYRYIAMFPFSFEPSKETEVYSRLARFLVNDHRVADAAWIYQVNDSLIDLVAQEGAPVATAPFLRLSRGMTSTVGHCISIHQNRLIKDCSKEPAYPPVSYPEPTIGSVICAHMTSDNECLGAVWLYTANRIYGEDELHQVEALATIAAFTVRRLQLKQRLEWLAHHDELTELPHRRGIIELAKSFKPRRGERRAVLFIDIDEFKKYNGADHEKGDQVIREIGLRLGGLIGKGHHVGRWGGDEFVGIVSVSEDRRGDLAEGIVASIASHPAAGQMVTVSLGAAWWNDEALASAVKRADEGMHSAKGAGKGRAVMADR